MTRFSRQLADLRLKIQSCTGVLGEYPLPFYERNGGGIRRYRGDPIMAASMREIPLNENQAELKFCRELEAASKRRLEPRSSRTPWDMHSDPQLAAGAGIIVNANRAAAAGFLCWEIEAGFSTTENLPRIVCFFGIADQEFSSR